MLVELKPMTTDQFEAFKAYLVPDYAAEKVRAGTWTEEESIEKSQAEIDGLFPEGLDTPDQYLFCVMDGATEVGKLWIAERTQGHKTAVWIFDIVTHEEHRRKGYATATFEALEKFILENLKSRRIELHVFGHNHGARALYQKLGFMETNVIMAKDLS